MKLIGEGIRPKQVVLDEAISEMKKIFLKTSDSAKTIQEYFKTKIDSNNKNKNSNETQSK